MDEKTKQYKRATDYYNAKDFKSAFPLFLELAKQGHAAAQCTLGSMYGHGSGVLRDDAEAMKWFRKSADQRICIAEYSIGYMHQHGNGVPRDYSEAMKWYQKAVTRSPPNASAQNSIGYMYQHGLGVKIDVDYAIQMYVQAYSNGNAAAAYNLAIYYQGEGNKGAREWMQRSADMGDYDAQRELGQMCETDGDIINAIHWYKKAADHGNQYALGLLQSLMFAHANQVASILEERIAQDPHPDYDSPRKNGIMN